MIVINSTPVFKCRHCNGMGQVSNGRADQWGQVMVGCCLEPCRYCQGTGKKQPAISLLPKEQTQLDKALEEFFSSTNR